MVANPRPAGRSPPLAAVLPTRVTPELQYLEAKFAGLVSYGLSATLLAELLPLGRPLHATAVRHHVQAVAQRLEDELGPERFSFIEGCPRDWAELPRPDLPLVVGLDGGYVHSSTQRSRRDGWFEVLKAQGMQANQQITFLADGGEDIRDLPLSLNPQAEHFLDWFHITMRLTVMTTMATSLPPPVDPDRSAPPDDVATSVGKELEHLK